MRRLTILILFVTAFSGGCLKAAPDILTLEAFVQLHIMTSNKEKEARERLAMLGAVQVTTTQETAGYKEKMEILHDRMKVANSWLVLASSLAHLGMKIYDVEKEVEYFISQAPAMARKSPFGATMYADAMYRIKGLLQQAIRDIASMELTGMNIMRATMKQRLNMVYYVQSTLDRIVNIMQTTVTYCRFLTGKEYTLMNITDLFNSQMCRDALCGTVSFWRKSSQTR